MQNIHAKMDQSYRRTVTDIDVTDTSYTMTTYYADDMSVLDTFTINKTDSSALKNLVNETESKKLNSNDYTEESWNTFQTALTNAKSVLENENASQSELDDAYNALKSAMDGLKAPEKKIQNRTLKLLSNLETDQVLTMILIPRSLHSPLYQIPNHPQQILTCF